MSDSPQAPSGGAALRRQLAAWAQVAAEVLDDAAETAGLAEAVRQSPYGSLGAALGTGYLLGGGLPSPTTARLLRLGLKLASVPVVQDKLLDVAEVALDAMLAKARKAQPPK
jgi:hypothetical protein